MKYEAAKKVLAFVICVFFVTAMLLSAILLLAHTHHEHDDAGFDGACSACINVTVAANLLKLIAVALGCAVFGSSRISVARYNLKAAYSHAVSLTLIRQKIKLNN